MKEAPAHVRDSDTPTPQDDEDPFIAVTRQTVIQLPGLVILKDLDSRIVAMNDSLAGLLGLESGTPARGRFEWELAKYLEPAAATFRKQDLDTITRRRVRFVDVLTYADGVPRAILSEKVCLVDSRNVPRALLFQGTDVTGQVFGSIGALLADHVGRVRRGGAPSASYALQSPVRQRRLTEREAECLFFLLRGQTARGIAAKLFLSPRTVEGYIEALKGAFDAQTKVELIERAINEGYGSYLPASLLFP